MNPTARKRPTNLTVAIVILWIQAAANLLSGIFLIAVADSDRDADFTAATGLVSVLAAPVLAVCSFSLIRRKVWARVPVVVVETLIVLGGLVTSVQALLAGGAPTGLVGVVLAGLVLQGCFGKESAAWLSGTAPRVAP